MALFIMVFSANPVYGAKEYSFKLNSTTQDGVVIIGTVSVNLHYPYNKKSKDHARAEVEKYFNNVELFKTEHNLRKDLIAAANVEDINLKLELYSIFDKQKHIVLLTSEFAKPPYLSTLDNVELTPKQPFSKSTTTQLAMVYYINDDSVHY